LRYLQHIHMAIFCVGAFFVIRLNKLPRFLERHGGKILIIVSALIVCFGIAVRIYIYVKNRSLWLDEALLAENIVARNWATLLTSPLINGQSAPVLYVVAVKAICSVLGYEEFSLRAFSLISFLGLLICEWFLLRKVLHVDDIKTVFVLMITTVVPCYVYYSNELKPYMSDAFFVVLAFLLYGFYTQNKISLKILTVFYALILGFSTPSVFFIGGILATEFLAAVFARDKKRIIHVSISGLCIAALFGLYYYWWMLPALGGMDSYWNSSSDKSQFNAFFIVVVILLYFLYLLHAEEKLYLKIFTLISYMLVLYFCPPAVYFIGVILAIELLASAFAKDRRRFVSILAATLLVAAVFGLYYDTRTFFVSETISDFWANKSSKIALANVIKNIFLVFSIKSDLVWVFVPFAALGVYSLIKQKNKVAYSVALSVFFVCLASAIGKWPLSGRLWLFLPAVILVFSSAGWSFISKGNNIALKKIIFCLFLAVPIYYTWYCVKDCSDNPDGMFVGSPEADLELTPVSRYYNTHIYTQEVNPLIKYVREHIKSDEKLYVYATAIPTFKFKNGYTTAKIGPTDKDNIIYGVSIDDWNSDKLVGDLDKIVKSRKAYLLFQHYWRGIAPGLEVLSQYGEVTCVLSNYDTPLLYFSAYE